MANELKHASQGSELTQGEFEGVGLHVFESQATGDLAYASSGTQLSRLAKGADNTFLQMGGSNIPEWVQDVTLQGASGSAMNQYWFADAGEDAADKWRVSVADGGTLTYDSFIGGAYATHMTITPNATASSSSVAFAGSITLGGDLAVAHGGTGASTLTANGVLIGNGTSAITSVAMATKGHILIGDGSGNPSMLAIGSNNQVLTADSGETTGVKWAATSGGVSEADAVALILALG
tara:strand:+ start:281 stop:988 length:708 start_codon:yes stop_codon:yes gene_type:complete